MGLVFRTTLAAAWILAVGLGAVELEVERIRIGHRIHNLLVQRDAQVERIRRLEIQYNRMVSPDILEKDLPDGFERAMGLAPRQTAARAPGDSDLNQVANPRGIALGANN